MKTRITSASQPCLAKVLSRLGIPPSAVQEGVSYIQASGETTKMTVCISRVCSPKPGFVADIYTGNDASMVEAKS